MIDCRLIGQTARGLVTVSSNNRSETNVSEQNIYHASRTSQTLCYLPSAKATLQGQRIPLLIYTSTM